MEGINEIACGVIDIRNKLLKTISKKQFVSKTYTLYFIQIVKSNTNS